MTPTVAGPVSPSAVSSVYPPISESAAMLHQERARREQRDNRRQLALLVSCDCGHVSIVPRNLHRFKCRFSRSDRQRLWTRAD